LPAKMWRRHRKFVVSTLIKKKLSLLAEKKSQNSYTDVRI